MPGAAKKVVDLPRAGAVCAQYPDCLYLSARSLTPRSGDWERGEGVSPSNSISARPNNAESPSCQSMWP